jgi:O-antigen chain-terminating methyltransferase
MAAQVVEHLAPPYLVRLLATAYEKLRPGAPLVVETINPSCWLAFFSSYIRDFTHAQPIHPETLQYLLQANGFGRVTLQYSQPVPEHMKMQLVDVAQAGALAQMARTVNANAVILNNLLFTYLDYAAIGYRS